MTAGDVAGAEVAFGGQATVDNPVNEAGGFRVTSDVLPVEQFPHFSSSSAMEYAGVVGSIAAVEGEFAAGAEHLDESFMRLGRTFDLTATTAAEQPRFEAQMAWVTEESYDNVLVEAHTVGQEDWTTLPELGGGTSTAVPAECEGGFYLGAAPVARALPDARRPMRVHRHDGSVERLHG